MIPVLYPPNAADFSTFGLGVLTDTISCEVTEERNGVFECLLKYPVSGQHYGLITKECIVKAKPNDTAAEQAFRIYCITKPLNGIVTIYGQHISYDIVNVPVLPFSTESRSPQLVLSQFLAGDTRFTGWTDYSDAKAFSVTQPKSVRACLGGTEGSMLSKWYSEFEWDNFTVKFHSHRRQKTGMVIEYGKNLTALEQDEDNSGVYTALLPYAVYTPEGSDAETVVTLPEVTLPIVTSEIVRTKTLIMDFQKTFIPDPITHKTVVNCGEISQFLVEDCVPAIIEKKQWLAAQEMRKRHQGVSEPPVKALPFRSLIFCGTCGKPCPQYSSHSEGRQLTAYHRCISWRDHTAAEVPGMTYIPPHKAGYNYHPTPEFAAYRETYKKPKSRPFLCTDVKIRTERFPKAFVQAWNLIVSKKQRYLPSLQNAAATSDNPLTAYRAEEMISLLETTGRLEEFDFSLMIRTLDRVEIIQPKVKLYRRLCPYA